MKYASVIIPVALPGTFSYSVPEELEPLLGPGVAVVVNFGKSKLFTAIVKELHNEIHTEFDVKPILSVSGNCVTAQQLTLWEWIASYYCCTLGEVMKAALPQALRPDSETRYLRQPLDPDELPELNNRQYLLYNAMNTSKPVSVDNLAKYTGIRNPVPILQQLFQMGCVTVEQFFTKAYKPAIKKFIMLADLTDAEAHAALDSLKRSPAQQSLLEFLLGEPCDAGDDKAIALADVLLRCNTNMPTINKLAKKSYIRIENRVVGRLLNQDHITGLKELTPQQQACKNQIETHFSTHDVVLLHGVTSSGKTEIYLSLIADALKNGKTALYLLPEIAITTQIIKRIRDAFGPVAGVYHSKYSDAERAEVWNKVSDGTYTVVLGVRSAIFLPFQNLGLIVVDEEHETTYKQQDPAPRYHARDVALVLAARYAAKLVLGTATPSLESYYNCLNGKYALVSLNERYGHVALPEIMVVDTRDAIKRKIMRFHFHPLLIDEIKTALAHNEQVILFRNRRGYSPYVECGDCGFVAKCEFCNVSLTYHKQRKAMVCHYCGNTLALLTECPECKSARLRTMGFGTEQLEDEAAHFFPDAVISRLDLDTAGTRGAYEKIISDFENHRADILIGTQMISKGLDFGNVSVVGILNADSMLNFPDFRAFERSFQMMLQVSGRAGRKEKRGKVIIQTTMPDHEILTDILQADFTGMAQRELAIRTHFRYPPVYRFVRIKLSHPQYDIAAKAASVLAEKLTEMLPGRIMGPEEPLVSKVRNQWLRHVVVRFETSLSAARVKQHILTVVADTEKHAGCKGIHIILDVDPI